MARNARKNMERKRERRNGLRRIGSFDKEEGFIVYRKRKNENGRICCCKSKGKANPKLKSV